MAHTFVAGKLGACADDDCAFGVVDPFAMAPIGA